MTGEFRQGIPASERGMHRIISVEEIEGLLALDAETRPRKKVLLVDGNGITYGKDTQYRFEGTGITPFGLARLAGYLEKYGIPVTIIRLVDFQAEGDQAKLMELVSANDIIGVSALSTDVDSTFSFCRTVKEQFPDKMTVGGAEHLALDAEWILQNQAITGIDITCAGEGQIPLLALSLGVPKETVGALHYKDGETIKTNPGYGRLTENGHNLMQVEPAKPLPKEWLKMIFPEMKGSFEYCGNAQTGSGCPFSCEFCTAPKMYLPKYENQLVTAEREIEALFQEGIDFTFVRDAILNSDYRHLDAFIALMKKKNAEHDKPMGWFAFMAAIKGEKHRRFKDIAEAGCVMIGVGVEDVVGNRKSLGKGADSLAAINFIEEAKEHVLVRTLMILGLPDHYNFTREEIKSGILDFMKAHPQAIFRFNQWTPLVGTADFAKYSGALLVDPRQDVKGFRKFDTMHNVVNPEAMYEAMKTPAEKRWIEHPDDWLQLKTEILAEYLNSPEYFAYVESLRGRVNLGKENLLHTIAGEFRADILSKT